MFLIFKRYGLFHEAWMDIFETETLDILSSTTFLEHQV